MSSIAARMQPRRTGAQMAGKRSRTYPFDLGASMDLEYTVGRVRRTTEL